MTTRSEAIIARMRARTRATRKEPAPVPEPYERTLPPVIISNREPMRPRLHYEDRECDCRHHGFHRRVRYIYIGFKLEKVASRKGKRGARKPRYKTDHTQRRI